MHGTVVRPDQINEVWNADRIATLIQLWGDGVSCSLIAEKIGGPIGRNAVIGKAHRLRLPSRTSHRRGKPSQRVRGAPTAFRKPPAGNPRGVKLTTEHKIKIREGVRRFWSSDRGWAARADLATARQVRAAAPVVQAGEPYGPGIPFERLEARNCRYPSGEGPYLFCGAHTEKTYCAFHHSLCHGG
jgi:hypothetical protein